jgi:hypothetical protein
MTELLSEGHARQRRKPTRVDEVMGILLQLLYNIALSLKYTF